MTAKTNLSKYAHIRLIPGDRAEIRRVLRAYRAAHPGHVISEASFLRVLLLRGLPVVMAEIEARTTKPVS